MFKITINKNGLTYAGRFNTQEECLTWRAFKHPASVYEIEDITAANIIQKLWETCNDYCISKIDINDRTRYNAWLIDGNTTQKTKIRDNIAWVDSIWTEYYNRKANLSENYDWTNFGDPPHSFYDIATSV